MVLRHVRDIRINDCIDIGQIRYVVEASRSVAADPQCIELKLRLCGMPGNARIVLRRDDLVGIRETDIFVVSETDLP